MKETIIVIYIYIISSICFFEIYIICYYDITVHIEDLLKKYYDNTNLVDGIIASKDHMLLNLYVDVFCFSR